MARLLTSCRSKQTILSSLRKRQLLLLHLVNRFVRIAPMTHGPSDARGRSAPTACNAVSVHAHKIYSAYIYISWHIVFPSALWYIIRVHFDCHHNRTNMAASERQWRVRHECRRKIHEELSRKTPGNFLGFSSKCYALVQ